MITATEYRDRAAAHMQTARRLEQQASDGRNYGVGEALVADFDRRAALHWTYAETALVAARLADAKTKIKERKAA